jgi:hypothetical protein
VTFQLLATALVLLGSVVSTAQIMIDNPQHLDIPEQRAQVLHNIICRVVAEEFHIRGGKVEGPVVLILGEQKEQSTADEFNRVYTIYLERWDEATFAISDIRLAVQRMVFRNHWERMAREVVRRAEQVSPVVADSMRPASNAGLATRPKANNCMAIRNFRWKRPAVRAQSQPSEQ